MLRKLRPRSRQFCDQKYSPSNRSTNECLKWLILYMFLLIVWVVFCPMNVHLKCNLLSNMFQSASKQYHCTETALLKLYKDISLNRKGHSTNTISLSEAFDTRLFCSSRSPL